MSLPQYSLEPAFDVEDSDNIQGGQVVCEISDDELAQLHRHMHEHPSAAWNYAMSESVPLHRPKTRYSDNEEAEIWADVFALK